MVIILFICFIFTYAYSDYGSSENIIIKNACNEIVEISSDEEPIYEINNVIRTHNEIIEILSDSSDEGSSHENSEIISKSTCDEIVEILSDSSDEEGHIIRSEPNMDIEEFKTPPTDISMYFEEPYSVESDGGLIHSEPNMGIEEFETPRTNISLYFEEQYSVESDGVLMGIQSTTSTPSLRCHDVINYDEFESRPNTKFIVTIPPSDDIGYMAKCFNYGKTKRNIFGYLKNTNAIERLVVQASLDDIRAIMAESDYINNVTTTLFLFEWKEFLA